MQSNFLWHSISQSETGNTVQLTCILQGVIDKPLLQTAWAHVVNSHQSLRSTVHWENVPAPVQVIHKAVDTNIKFIDTTLYADVDQYVVDDRKHSIDLTRPVTSRLAVYENHPTSIHVIWSMSHVLIDGWSASIVINDWLKTYSALLRGESLTVPRKLLWSDYARWHTRQDGDESLAYWRDYLNKPSLSALKPSERKEALSSVESVLGTVEAELDYPASKRLQTALQVAGISTGTVLQAGFATLIRSLTGTESVVFGTTVSGRHADLPAIDERVGMMINMIPLAMDLGRDETTGQCLTRLQKEFFACMPHSHVNAVDIAALHPHGSAMFNHLLVVENQPAAASTPEVSVSEYKSAMISASDMTLIAIPAENLGFSLIYKETLYPDQIEQDLMDILLEFLRKLPDYLNKPLHQLLSDLSVNGLDTAYDPARETVSRSQGHTSKEPVDDNVREVTLLEYKLKRIWCDLLNLENVASDTSFFDSGGTSLQAVMLFERIESSLGIKLPPTTLFSYPSISELARLMENQPPAAAWSGVVGIHQSGAKTPLFIPYEQADMLMYQSLVVQLGHEQPVYGLNVAQGDYPSEEELQAMVQKILKIHPDGPYQLGGVSGAGIIAWDLAQRLTTSGHKVELLVLLDTYGPDFPLLLPVGKRIASVSGKALRQLVSVGTKSCLHALRLLHRSSGSRSSTPAVSESENANAFSQQFQRHLDQEARLARAMIHEISSLHPSATAIANRIVSLVTGWQIRSVNMRMEFILFTQGLLLQHCRSILRIEGDARISWSREVILMNEEELGTNMTATRRMLRRYQTMYQNIKPYEGRVLYCRAKYRPKGCTDDPLAGWHHYLIGDVTRVETSGNHTTMLKPPHVESLGASVRKQLI